MMKTGLILMLISLLLGSAFRGWAIDERIVSSGTRSQPSLETNDAFRAAGLGAAAAFTMGISVLGAGYAVGRIGSAVFGAAAEKPELLTRSLLFLALAEGLAVLGFVIAILILQKI